MTTETRALCDRLGHIADDPSAWSPGHISEKCRAAVAHITSQDARIAELERERDTMLVRKNLEINGLQEQIRALTKRNEEMVERCAKVADEHERERNRNEWESGYSNAACHIALAIRALPQSATETKT